ncbi:MAG: carboxypeptidase regulatory-like domain-containing protein [Bryobacteraceae bacterium]
MLRNVSSLRRAPAGSMRILAVLLVLCVSIASAQIDRGTIQGSVKDSSGAVVPGAKVQIIRVDTNSTIDLATNEEGLYLAPNLPAATYKVTVQKEGFSTFVREPVIVRARVEVRLDAVLQPGAVTESLNITAAAPLLDTAAVNNSAALPEDLIGGLPLIVVGTKRDITSFLNNLPGTTNTNTFVPAVNAAPTGATEAFIDGAPASERIMRGAISENGPVLEQVGEVSVVTNAFNAEYGGFGNWFTNVTIKSGTNALRGSVFDHLGNDKLNARSFFQPKRTSYRQNEGGVTLGGPVVIPGLYDGRDKTFFFGSLGVFFSRYGASGNIMTIPTQEFVRGDFSKLVNAAGAQIPIFDPSTTAPDGAGGFVRTPFAGNVIPSDRISAAGKVVGQYMPPTSLPGQQNNYYSKAAATWPYYNTWTPIVKIDHSISTKQKMQGSFTAQRRPRIIWSGGMAPLVPWGAKQTNPLDNVFDQKANSWKVRLNHDYIFTPAVLNHVTLYTDRYYNLGINKTQGQGWNPKLGVTGIPFDLGEFPQITFSGGQVTFAQLNRAYNETWHDLRYGVMENLTYLRGKHSMKFGAEIHRDRINRFNHGGVSGSFNFSNGATSQPNSPSYGVWGNAYASFLLAGVNSASALIPVTTGMRYVRYALFAQDEFRASDRLTLSYGLRWDYHPPAFEVNNRMSSFVFDLVNPGAGNRLGALGFAGKGTGRVGDNFVDKWRKGFGPRLGISYQLDPKTVVRASGGIYYSNWGAAWQDPYSAGFSTTPAFSSPDGYTPIYYLGTGTFPQNFARPPALDPSFRNGQTIQYLSRNGTRLPQTVNYTFSIQRELASHLAVEAVYLGSKSTHTSFSVNYNYMPIENLKYGMTLLQPITSPAAAAIGVTSPFPGFQNQTGANTVYQALRPYPQYTAVTSSPTLLGTYPDPVGQQKFNSLQLKVNKRFSSGLTLFGFFTWMKSFSLALDQYPGARLMQLDANPAATFSFSWAYDLPFGKGKSLLNTDSRAINAAVSGWKINGMVKYNSGLPLSITAGAGRLSSVGYTQRGNAVSGVSPYLVTNPREFTPTSKYLNAAAFQTTTDFNFGNLAPVLSWVRGFWGKQEALTLGRVFSVTERFKLDFSVDAVNPFNFHRWGAPNTNLLSPAFGTVTSASDGRTLQVNAALKF